MSKDKRGRKCKGRHCAWCAPVVKPKVAVVERAGFLPLPVEVTSYEELQEWLDSIPRRLR